MRVALAVLIIVIGGSAVDRAQADPYQWCALYSIRGGATNCWFVTLDQCKMAVSGVGGICRPNLFYDGRPEGSGSTAAGKKKTT